MNQIGEASDQAVRIIFERTELTIRLTGQCTKKMLRLPFCYEYLINDKQLFKKNILTSIDITYMILSYRYMSMSMFIIVGDLLMKDYKNNALLFKAFCDESRLQILDLIRGEETCSCVLLHDLTIGQSTLSHHMKILVESGIVSSRKEGKNTMYALDLDAYQRTKQILHGIFCADEVKTKSTVKCK